MAGHAAWPAAHSVMPAAARTLAAGGGSGSPLWYTTRATGVVALLLLTGTVALGVAGIARVDSPQMPRLVRSGLHRNLSLLTVAFVCVHVVTTVLDPFVRISIVSAIVPFSSSYRPLWLSLGAIAFDLLLAVVITSLVRTRMPYRAWHAVHWLAYVSWPVALWHGLGTGTDSRLPWLLLLDAVCVLIVAGVVLWRLRLAPSSTVRTAGLIVTTAFVIATIVFVAVGPLQSGWARRAGTPASTAGGAGVAAVHGSRANPAPAGLIVLPATQPHSQGDDA